MDRSRMALVPAKPTSTLWCEGSGCQNERIFVFTSLGTSKELNVSIVRNPLWGAPLRLKHSVPHRWH
jgi:hypothetical protein